MQTKPVLAEDLRRSWEASRGSVIALGVFSAGINLLWLVPSLYMLQVYDRVLPSGSKATLLMLSLIVLFLLATMGLLEWVRSQIRSSACVCCHANEAPLGASNWNVDRPGNFVNGFHDRGLAMGAGWIDTVGFGAYPAADNNGFSRPTPEDPHQSIVPTTDRDRMLRFFVAELEHRGRTPESFTEKYGAGPLDDNASRPA